jgi:tetratricopeptide (TPR) repeat protein
MGRLPEAEKARREALTVLEKLDPKDVATLRARAVTYRNLRQYDKAIADLNKAVELDPKNVQAWNDRAVNYVDLHQYAKALADLTKAIELDPKCAFALFHRGYVYNELHQYDKALCDLNLAIDLDQKNVGAWNNRGRANMGLHQYDKALADHTKAIALKPKHPAAWADRGAAYCNLHQYDKALDDLNEAISLDPEDAAAWGNRSIAHSRLGEWDKALADASNALELQPDKAAVQNILALLLATCPETKLRDPKRAAELAGKAVRAAPNEGTFWTTLGAARYRCGDWKAAAAALQEAEKLLQSQGGFQKGVGRALFFQVMAQQQLGNRKEARQAYDRALKWLETNRQALSEDSALADELRRFRIEAAALLGIEAQPAEQEKKIPPSEAKSR